MLAFRTNMVVAPKGDFEDQELFANQTEHRLLPRDLGGRLMLRQGNPRTAGGRVRSGCGAVRLDTPEGDIATFKTSEWRIPD